MMHDDDESQSFDSFATVVSDGAYCHFLDDFISLIFYQTRVFPKNIVNGETDVKKKVEVLADVRLSRKAVKKLVEDLKDGLDMHPVFQLMQGKSDFFTGLISGEDKGDNKVKDLKLSDEEIDNIKNNVLVDIKEELTKEGEKEYNNTLIKILLDHADVFHEIVRKDKERKKENDKSKSIHLS